MKFKEFLLKQMFACAGPMLFLTSARIMALAGGIPTLWVFLDLALVVVFLLNQHYIWLQVGYTERLAEIASTPELDDAPYLYYDDPA